MPVRKFRSIEEMDAADDVWLEPGDPRLAAAIRRVWERDRRMAPRSFPPGVYKHRSIEAMNRQDEAWEVEAFGDPTGGDSGG